MLTCSSSFVLYSLFSVGFKKYKCEDSVLNQFVLYMTAINAWCFLQDQNKGIFIPIWKTPASLKTSLITGDLIVPSCLSPIFEISSVLMEVLSHWLYWDRIREREILELMTLGNPLQRFFFLLFIITIL